MAGRCLRGQAYKEHGLGATRPEAFVRVFHPLSRRSSQHATSVADHQTRARAPSTGQLPASSASTYLSRAPFDFDGFPVL
jgi:hypothetical protein